DVGAFDRAAFRRSIRPDPLMRRSADLGSPAQLVQAGPSMPADEGRLVGSELGGNRRPRERALTASTVAEELGGEAAGVCEREEMAAWKLVEGEMQSLLCHATLELEREEAVVASGDHVDRDRWPRLELARLGEGDVGLGALPCFS